MNQTPIPTYIINLKSRLERREHVLKEYESKDEFAVTIVEPIPHEIGAVSLWNTIKHIIQSKVSDLDNFVLICEDDHQFTQCYSKELFFDCIAEAIEKRADVLSGGVHWFNCALPISDNIFWVDKFTGAQFIIVFRHFFNAILEANFSKKDAADIIISDLANKIFFTSPFISVQKDFGYSDATPKNNVGGLIMEEYFAKSSANVQTLKDVVASFKNRIIERSTEESCDNISISTYIINLSGKLEDHKRIKKEFMGRSEFDIFFIESCKHEIGNVGSWLSILKIIRTAIANDDDVIIICEDNHKFTECYSKDSLIQNIIEAHEQGMEIVLGSVRGFGLAVPITKGRAWINHFYGAKFIILYRSIFQKILNEPFDDNVQMDAVLSGITSNKIILFPFISTKNDFGDVNLMKARNNNNEIIVSFLEDADVKLKKLYEASIVYNISFQ